MTKRICSTPECGRPIHARGVCDRCRHRITAGIPLDQVPKTPNGEPLAALKVFVAIAGDECQFWKYAHTGHGYALIAWQGRMRLAYHVAMILAEPLGCEPPPGPGMDARHTCGKGNLGCVNWRHIVVGTRTENMADKVIHGTQARGEQTNGAKLTEAQVREIRVAVGSQTAIAARYGINQTTVSQIKRRTRWAHLAD